MEYFQNLSPILQALFATLFTYSVTALGASMVFFTKKVNQKILTLMLGFAGGVMIAASYWSLLAPAIEMSRGKSLPVWFPVSIGFLSGGLFLKLVDSILPHLHIGFPMKDAEGLKTSWHRSLLLVMAITIHNIPEGLAVGVAFGAIKETPEATLGAAIALAFGIGIQNFPEGVAVAVPLRKEGLSRLKCFWYGQLSGIVEPIAGVFGAYAVTFAKPILPYALAFAAGAMIYVVVEEVIPEANLSGHSDISTFGVMIGFTIMMILDVALG